MTLLGEYTEAGAVLAAQIQAGTASLTITRAAAGSGHTEPQDTAMDNERQGLTLSALSREGATLTVPARLLSAGAQGAYTLTEIGLFAAKAGGGELLYKIYRFDRGVSVSPDCSLNATFYLHDTVAAGRQAAVTVSVDGLLSRADGEEIANAAINTLSESLFNFAANTETEQVLSCTVANIQKTINSLPKHLTRDTRINVTGTTALYAGIEIIGFYGPGKLSVVAASPLILSYSYLRIDGNHLPMITVEGFRFQVTSQGGYYPIPELNGQGLYSVEFALVIVRGNTGHTELRNVSLVPFETGVTSYVGIYIRGCTCTISDLDVNWRRHPVVADRQAHVVVRNIKTPSNSNTIATAMAAINGSTVVWPGTKATLSTYWGTTTTQILSGGKIFFGPNTVEIAAIG